MLFFHIQARRLILPVNGKGDLQIFILAKTNKIVEGMICTLSIVE